MKIEESDVALTHHWMFRMRGGEKVLQEFCSIFPNSRIGCLAFDEEGLSPEIGKHKIFGSVLQRSKWARTRYKELLPFHPPLIRRMKAARNAKLVLASDAGMIKGMPVDEDAMLVCYCHSPPRYIWEMFDTYANKDAGMGLIARSVFRFVVPICKRFDRSAANRVDLFIANSRFVATRIKKFYGKESIVIHPPVSYEDFKFDRPRQDFFLIVSELVPYKKIDLAVEAFNANGKPLVVIGDGPERQRLESMAKQNIKFLGRQPFEVLKEHYETCRAFVFPGLEDFGITPLEAQASGGPVIAYGHGGALETVIDNETGVFFDDQKVESLHQAIDKLEGLLARRRDDLSITCRRNAETFGADRFRREIVSAIKDQVASKGMTLSCVVDNTSRPTADRGDGVAVPDFVSN